MFKNYLKIAIRSFRRQNLYNVVNLGGLTISISCCIILSLYIFDELSFDKFHNNSNNIYRIATKADVGGNQVEVPGVPFRAGEILLRDFSEVKNMARVYLPGRSLLSHKEYRSYEENIYITDPAFLELFNFKVAHSLKENPLLESESIVISKTLAEKYFGNVDPLGKKMEFKNKIDLTVSGVLEDIPDQTHFDFDALMTFSSARIDEVENPWASFDHYTYIELTENTGPEQFRIKLDEFTDRYIRPVFEKFNGTGTLFLQPLTSIHLESHLQGEISQNNDLQFIYILASIAIFILILGSLNYTNLATSRSAKRSKEIGVRKVLGSHKSQIRTQFLIESVLATIFSIILGLILVDFLLPVFNELTGKSLSLKGGIDLNLIIFLTAILIIVNTFGGLYPAFLLAGFKPVDVLKGRLFISLTSFFTLRKVLVITQFSITFVIAILAWNMSRQLDYINNKDLGFDKDNVMIIDVGSAGILSESDKIKDAFLLIESISEVSSASAIPDGNNHTMSTFRAETVNGSKEILSSVLFADENYLHVMGINLVQGSGFSSDHTESKGALVNKAFVKTMGWQDPLGKMIYTRFNNAHQPVVEIPVTGVIRDYHLTSLKNEIHPTAIFYQGKNKFLLVKTAKNNFSQAIPVLESSWNQLFPDLPFEYSFMDERLGSLYTDEVRNRKILTLFSVVMLIIASFGLFGLSSFMNENMKMEIGVRKINGAGARNILIMIMKEYGLIVAVSIVIAWPLSYLLIKNWLSNFSYSIDINLDVFLISALAGFVIIILISGYHTLKAVFTNPVAVIRHE